jgi:hypothetical protein
MLFVYVYIIDTLYAVVDRARRQRVYCCSPAQSTAIAVISVVPVVLDANSFGN